MASRRALNPAFAAAHGLSKVADDNEDDDAVIVEAAPNNNAKSSAGGNHKKRLELLIKEARATGKLQASNIGLKAPLPDALFDFRAGVVVDLSLESSAATTHAIVHGEETLTSVDLSDNHLSGSLLDERVLRYEEVQILRWKRCGLVGMVNLSSLQQLAVLDLAGNQLKDFCLDWIPDTLQELNLANNSLCQLSSSSGATEQTKSLEYLVSIDLSHNQLETLDFFQQAVVSAPRLRSFHCHHNRLKSISLDSMIMSSSQKCLQTLDASHNQLQGGEQPLDLSMFTQLQSVLLSSNRLTIMPCIPLSVKRLDLTTNKIQTIKGMFQQQKEETLEKASLVELLLQDNHLAELEAAIIANCVELQRLDLSSNMLKTLPYQLGFLPKLQHLTLTGNPLYSFKASEVESTKAMLEKLRNRAPKSEVSSNNITMKHQGMILSSSSVLLHNHTIHLAGNAGTPGQVVDLEKLVLELKGNPQLSFGICGKLLLDKNSLDSIPDDLLPQLVNLTELSLEGNDLKALPPSLATSCPHLTKLSVSDNQITQIDDIFLQSTITRATKCRVPWAQTLTHLDVSNNRLAKISGDVLKQLSKLQILSLKNNKLTSVQDWYYLPPSLLQLDFSENMLEHGVENLILLLGAHCSGLEALQLQQNHIHRIPSTVGMLQERCPNLKWLDLKGNPQHSIRPDVLAKQTRDQLIYLMNRLTVEQKMAANEQMEELLLNGQKETLPNSPVKAPTEIDETLKSDGQAATGQVLDEKTSTISLQDEEAAKVEAVLSGFRSKIDEFESQLEDLSLSQAKRYAVKKSLAMERSKLIREERKLGLRK